jgi:hypothetical protein
MTSAFGQCGSPANRPGCWLPTGGCGRSHLSVGVGVLGAADEQLWISSDVGDVSVIDAGGEVTDLDVESGPLHR